MCCMQYFTQKVIRGIIITTASTRSTTNGQRFHEVICTSVAESDIFTNDVNL